MINYGIALRWHVGGDEFGASRFAMLLDVVDRLGLGTAGKALSPV